MGLPGCPGLATGQSRGLIANVIVSPPANAQFFVAGERASLIVSMHDHLGFSYQLAELAWLLFI